MAESNYYILIILKVVTIEKICVNYLIIFHVELTQTLYYFYIPSSLLRNHGRLVRNLFFAKNVLRLARADEVFQLLMLGSSFLPKFGLLKQSLFNYLK